MQPHPKNDLLYLLRILEAIEKINLYAASFEEPLPFYNANDGKEFNACLMLLTQVGEQSAKLSEQLKIKYPGVNWNEIKGFRNRAVHDYTGLDLFITFDIIKQHLFPLKTAVSEIIRKEIESGTFDKEEFNIAKTSIYLKHVDFSFIEKN